MSHPSRSTQQASTNSASLDPGNHFDCSLCQSLFCHQRTKSAVAVRPHAEHNWYERGKATRRVYYLFLSRSLIDCGVLARAFHRNLSILLPLGFHPVIHRANSIVFQTLARLTDDHSFNRCIGSEVPPKHRYDFRSSLKFKQLFGWLFKNECRDAGCLPANCVNFVDNEYDSVVSRAY